MVYASADPAAAVLEALAHLDRQDQAEPHELVRIELPAGLCGAAVLEHELPDAWQRHKPLTRSIGNRWFDEGAQPVLWVPSALVPQAWNALLNASHPAWSRPGLTCIAFEFDRRLCG